MAKQPTIVNKFGKVIGWNSVTLSLLGRDVEGITELEYNDSVEKENVYGAGSFPVGRGEGNYTATASITLMEEERRALLASLPPSTRLQEIAPFAIPVAYEYQNEVYKDIVHNCEFMNNGIAVKQNDKTVAYKFDLIISHITWNI